MIIFAIFIFTIFVLFFLLIYSCIRISTPYDREEDNREQEEFIRNYQRKKKNSQRNSLQKWGVPGHVCPGNYYEKIYMCNENITFMLVLFFRTAYIITASYEHIINKLWTNCKHSVYYTILTYFFLFFCMIILYFSFFIQLYPAKLLKNSTILFHKFDKKFFVCSELRSIFKSISCNLL